MTVRSKRTDASTFARVDLMAKSRVSVRKVIGRFKILDRHTTSKTIYVQGLAKVQDQKALAKVRPAMLGTGYRFKILDRHTTSKTIYVQGLAKVQD